MKEHEDSGIIGGAKTVTQTTEAPYVAGKRIIQLTREQGIKEIEEANWTWDEHKVLNLVVHTEEGREVKCWLQLRPHYCDRGHIMLNVWGPLNIDGQDSFPRYFFNSEEAKTHTRKFLKWRLWQEREDNHVLE